MKLEKMKEFLEKKPWHNVEIEYMHKDPLDLRLTYFRAQTIEEAVKLFRDCTNPDEDIILSMFLDNELQGDWEK